MKLQRLPKNFDGVAMRPSAHVTILRGIGAMMSSHHGVWTKIRYNDAVQRKWRWFV